LEYQK